MIKEITLKNQKVSYSLKRNKRSKYMRFAIKSDASLVVSVPRIFPQILVEKMIFERADWILDKINYFKNKKSTLPKATKEDYLKYKELAREIIERKLKYYNQFYNLSWSKISIRNQKTRWGSCSRDGNLSFSYRIIYLPEKSCDYIVVHELCHRGEFNHSKKFWALVEKTVPDYKKIKKEIKGI